LTFTHIRERLREKGLSVKTGQTPLKKTILMLMDMIIAGIAKPI
jgi:hypothetical protein